MRRSQKRVYRDHEFRVVKRFAWFPIICRQRWDNRVDSQTVWLKTVYVRQEHRSGYNGSWWSNEEFVGEGEHYAHLEETRAILAGPHPPRGGEIRFR